MRLTFSKMHGRGNDFVMLNGVSQPRATTLTVAQRRHLANRHFGVGCDQILLVERALSPDNDFRYRIFNADGGEVEQCGNGTHCFAQFVRNEGLTTKHELRVETMRGIISPYIAADGLVTTNMGAPIFIAAEIPFVDDVIDDVMNGASGDKPQQIRYSLDINGSIATIGAVSMGNPHAVQVVDDVDAAPVGEQGPLIEHHTRFPARVNAGYMQVVSCKHIRLRVWERGAGETLSCGTGACAAVVTGIRWGLLDRDGAVRVTMRGGEVSVTWRGDVDSEESAPVFMSGFATTVYRGEIEIPE